MPRTFIFMALAIVISIAIYFILDKSMPSTGNRELLSFLAGLVPTAAFFLIDKLNRPEPEVSAQSDAPLATARLSWAFVVAIMTLAFLLTNMTAQVFVWSIQNTMQSYPSSDLSKTAYHVLSVTFAGAMQILTYLGVALIALVVGVAGAPLKYWYFLVPSLIVSLLVFLPRIVMTDPASLTITELLKIVSGIDLTGNGGGYSTLTIATIQLMYLAVSMFGAPLLWWLCALAGRTTRGVFVARIEAAPRSPK